jgi:hypothetical protein
MIWSDQQRDGNDCTVQLAILMAYTPYRVSHPVRTIDSAIEREKRKHLQISFCCLDALSVTFFSTVCETQRLVARLKPDARSSSNFKHTGSLTCPYSTPSTILHSKHHVCHIPTHINDKLVALTA